MVVITRIDDFHKKVRTAQHWLQLFIISFQFLQSTHIVLIIFLGGIFTYIRCSPNILGNSSEWFTMKFPEIYGFQTRSILLCSRSFTKDSKCVKFEHFEAPIFCLEVQLHAGFFFTTLITWVIWFLLVKTKWKPCLNFGTSKINFFLKLIKEELDQNQYFWGKKFEKNTRTRG